MFCINKKMREENFEPRVRASLMNGLSGIKNATLIATLSPDGKSNVTVFSSVFHLGADPSLMGLIFRPVPGHTLTNILANKKFTLNHLPSSSSKLIHQSSARYQDSEFSACNWQEEYLGAFEVPFIKESSVKWSMHMLRMIEIPENGTHMMIAEVQDIYLASKELMRADGSLDIKDKLCGVIGLDSYHEVGAGTRYRYAKPDKSAEAID